MRGLGRWEVWGDGRSGEMCIWEKEEGGQKTGRRSSGRREEKGRNRTLKSVGTCCPVRDLGLSSERLEDSSRPGAEGTGCELVKEVPPHPASVWRGPKKPGGGGAQVRSTRAGQVRALRSPTLTPNRSARGQCGC